VSQAQPTTILFLCRIRCRWRFWRWRYGQQLHVEDQRGVGRDDVFVSSLPVGQDRRDAKLAFAAYLHSSYALVPSFDHFPFAEREIVGLVRVDGAVEFLAVGEPSGVMDLDVVTLFGLATGTDLDIPILQAEAVVMPSPVTLVGAAVLGAAALCLAVCARRAGMMTAKAKVMKIRAFMGT
jgi:hypothetical protein